VPLQLSKYTVFTRKTSNIGVLLVSYLQHCRSTSMPFSFQGSQLDHKCNIAKCNSQRVDLCLACHTFS